MRKIEIWRARPQDYAAICELVRANPKLQYDPEDFPYPDEFVTVRRGTDILACMAVMRYNDKFADVCSFNCKIEALWSAYIQILLDWCIEWAGKQKIRQLVAFLSKERQERELELFQSKGFHTIDPKAKHALFKPVRGLRLAPVPQLSGIRIIQARTEHHWEGLKRVVRQYPDVLIQPEGKDGYPNPQFPPRHRFSIAVDERIGDEEEQVVGCTAYTIFRRRRKIHPLGPQIRRAEIRAVAVEESYGHRGIGPALITHSTNRAVESGADRLFTVTGKLDLFKKQNFTDVVGSEVACFKELSA